MVMQFPDIETRGFQYADWLCDGDDIISMARTIITTRAFSCVAG